MQTYEDLDTLAQGLRNTIDYIVGNNMTLRGEIPDAMAVLRETMDMKCLNEPDRVTLIQTRIVQALRALESERLPTGWITEAMNEIAARPQEEAPADLDAGSFEAVAPVIVTDDPEQPWHEPEAPALPDEDEEPEAAEDAPVTDPRAYILALQAQLRANGVEPIAEDALDYVRAVAESLVFAEKPSPSARLAVLMNEQGAPLPPQVNAEVQKIDGVNEV